MLIICSLVSYLVISRNCKLLVVPVVIGCIFYVYTSSFIPLIKHSQQMPPRFIGTVKELKTEKMFLLEDSKLNKVYRVYINTKMSSPKVGDICKVEGEFETIDDKGKLLLHYYFIRERIIGSIMTESLSCSNNERTVKFLLPSFKERLIKNITDNETPNASAIIVALALGDTRYLSTELQTIFRELGLSHILAISGSHFTFLAIIFLWSLKRVHVTMRIITYMLLILFPLYAILVGTPAAVLRATIMACLLLVVKEFRIKITPQEIFLLTYLLVLFYQPLFLLDIGFIYSFSITFLFLTLVPHYYFDHIPSVAKLFQLQILITVITMPLTIYLQNSISFIGIIVNPIVSPIFEFVLFPIALVTIIFLFCFDIIGIWMMEILEGFLELLYKILFYLNNVPFSHLLLESHDEMLLVYCLFCIVSFLYGWSNWKRIQLFLSILIVLIAVHFYLPYIQNNGELVFLNVEQGDSILLDFPYRKEVWLIDTGGKVNVMTGENNHQIFNYFLSPALKKRGISRIDKLILTHDDSDHIGEAEKIIDYYQVDEIVIGNCSQLKEQTKSILRLANKKRIKVNIVKKEMDFQIGTVRVKIFPSSLSCMEGDNNNSILVHISNIDGKKILLTGDMEEEGEKEFVKAFPNMKADILKVGHHGSKTSTTKELLEHVNPKEAIISVGRKNRYGHPHENVLHTLRKENIKVYRTDQNGDKSYFFQFR